MKAKKNISSRVLVLVLAVAVLIGCVAGGTLAWLLDTTPAVTNTFTVGDVTLTLKESPITVADDGTVTYGAPAENTSNTYPALPGSAYKKDPVVEVDEGSEKCYLFVKFEYTAAASTYYTYTSNLNEDNGWTNLSSDTGSEVWYRIVEKGAKEDARKFALLADQSDYEDGTTLIVNNSVTNENNAVAAAQSLKWTAYAVQYENMADANAAWDALNS